MSKPLSPAAQAVNDAPTRAAALRALADQVVPKENPFPSYGSNECRDRFNTPEEWMEEGTKQEQREQTRAQIHAIAAELEAKR